MDRLMLRRSSCSIAAVLLLGASALPAWGEMYIAGQVGLTSPRNASQVDLAVDQTLLPPVSLSDLELKNSIMYGGKLGYYFLSSNSKCNTSSPDGLRCCHAHEILSTHECRRT